MSYTSVGDPGVDAENLKVANGSVAAAIVACQALIAASSDSTQAYWLTVLEILNDDPTTL